MNAKPLLSVLVLGLIFTASGSGQAQQQTQDAIAGLYECQGVGPDGAPYRGIVEIAKKDHTYRLQWTLSEDGGVYLGLGIIKGDTLAVSYFGEIVGVVLYRIEEGRLIGEWTVVGADGQVYSETLTKLAANATRPMRPEKRSPRGVRGVRVRKVSAGI